MITLYYRDHEPPHFRTVYGEYQVQIVIATLDLLFGELPPRALRLVREWNVDLEGELWGPMFEPLRANADLFRQVHVDEELGTIVWPNGADMDPDVLHGDFEPADEAAASHASPAKP